AALGGLADDLELAFVAQDVGDADAEERMVVDDEDADLVGRDASSAALAAICLGCHVLSSPGIGMPIAPGGIVMRTAVPRFGLDRTSNLAPISSARSRMNWRPKWRRPLTGGSSASKPLPSSRTSTVQPAPSLPIQTRMERAWA